MPGTYRAEVELVVNLMVCQWTERKSASIHTTIPGRTRHCVLSISFKQMIAKQISHHHELDLQDLHYRLAVRE